MRLMSALDLCGKKVLIRSDLNVPIQSGVITSDNRIKESLPTIQQAARQRAKIMLMSHLGRPEEGSYDERYSLALVADRMATLLGCPVRLVRDWIGRDVDVAEGEVVLFENVRFNAGEQSNDEALAKEMARLCDVFVMDAFATAHRAQASTCGVARFAPLSCAGALLTAELSALERAFERPKRPLVSIVGGAKVSTKLTVLEALGARCDQLIVGGGIANTFIRAAGHQIGRSLHEEDLVAKAAAIMLQMQQRGAAIPIAEDVATGSAFTSQTMASIKPVTAIAGEDYIFDVGPRTARRLAAIIASAGTVVWNGPMGVFEWQQFGHGTEVVARAIARSAAYSVAGGGDTLAAVEHYGVERDISYVSTGGGAFLEFLGGKTLPAIAALQ